MKIYSNEPIVVSQATYRSADNVYFKKGTRKSYDFIFLEETHSKETLCWLEQTLDSGHLQVSLIFFIFLAKIYSNELRCRYRDLSFIF